MDTQILQPPLLADDQPIGNPMSGFYADNLLQSQFTAPLSTEPFERYENIFWSCLENNGGFDFSIIDKALEHLPQGVRFAFTLKAFDPSQVGAGLCHLPNAIPDDLATSEHGFRLPFNPADLTQGSYFVPDWNDPVVLGRMKALLSALGQRYDGDLRLAWVDIGMYGSWGEWHTQGLPHYPRGIPYKPTDLGFSFNARQLQPGTPASKEFIVDAHVEAFPTTQLVMLTDDGDGLCHALRLEPESHIGLRRDSLGSGSKSWTFQFPDHLPGCNSADDVARILNRWQVAPFVAEPFGGQPPQTFNLCPSGSMQEFCIDQEARRFHVATVQDSDLGSDVNGNRVTWTELSPEHQQAFLFAGYHAGYRFAPVTVEVKDESREGRSAADEEAPARMLSVQTSWINSGLTPAYNRWNVEFSLWKVGMDGSVRPDASFTGTSRVDLRKVFPTGNDPFICHDEFRLPRGLENGTYELRIKVIDPDAYLSPLHLALQAATADGSYILGHIHLSRANLGDR